MPVRNAADVRRRSANPFLSHSPSGKLSGLNSLPFYTAHCWQLLSPAASPRASLVAMKGTESSSSFDEAFCVACWLEYDAESLMQSVSGGIHRAARNAMRTAGNVRPFGGEIFLAIKSPVTGGGLRSHVLFALPFRQLRLPWPVQNVEGPVEGFVKQPKPPLA